MKAVYVLCLLGILANSLMAGDPPVNQVIPPPSDTPEEGKAAETQAVGGAGMIVTIDAERGTIVDGSAAELSDEMREALANMINTSSEGLKEVTLADGTVLVDLQGRFRSAMVATVGADGKVRTNCISSDPKHQHSESCNQDKHDRKPENQ